MKLWRSEHTFTHPWETVVQAVWRKYPNPHNPKVIGSDVLERGVVNGVLYSRRLMLSDWGLQRWVKNLIGNDQINYGLETSTCDLHHKAMVMNTQNITFCRNISVDEVITYKPHPENPQHTQLVQETTLKVMGVPFTSYMEHLLQSSMSANTAKGRMALDWVIGTINTEMADLSSHATKTMSDISSKVDGLSEVAKKALTEEFTNVHMKSANMIDDAKKAVQEAIKEGEGRRRLNSLQSHTSNMMDELQNLPNRVDDLSEVAKKALTEELTNVQMKSANMIDDAKKVVEGEGRRRLNSFQSQTSNIMDDLQTLAQQSSPGSSQRKL